MRNVNIRLQGEGIDIISGTKIGGSRAAATNKVKHGADFYAKIGAIGGKKGHTGGFFDNSELASRAGKLGGLMSRRGKHKLTDKERLQIRKAYEELTTVHNKATRQRQFTKTRLDEGAMTVYTRKRGLIKQTV